MLRRRVPVLRLGSRGPGGDQKSLRLCRKAPASVRLCRAFLAVEMVAKRRTIVTFWTLRYKSVNSHRACGAGGGLHKCLTSRKIILQTKISNAKKPIPKKTTKQIPTNTQKTNTKKNQNAPKTPTFLDSTGIASAQDPKYKSAIFFGMGCFLILYYMILYYMIL